MEFIKKRILQIVTTGATTGATDCKGTYPICTGCTGVCVNIIPDTGATYCIKFGLVQDAQDIGFFDAYTIDTGFYYIKLSGATSAITAQNIIKFEKVLSGGTTLAASGLITGYSTGNITGTTTNYMLYVVTGSSSSRLVELRKYTITSDFNYQYVSGGTYAIDGVDYPNSVSGSSIIYFLGGIRYVDTLTGITSGTTFNFTTYGVKNNPNFINKPIYKDPNKENIISNPKIYDDVFIIRQELSAYDKNYRLEYIGSLVDLETYAGGGFFNIVNNT